MRRNVFGSVLVVIFALGCSACGSAKAVRHTPDRTTTNTMAQVVRASLQSDTNLVVLPPTHGAGNKTFGTFTPEGTVFLEYTCTGGPLTIVGFGGPRPCDGVVSVGISNYEGKPMNLTLRAKPGTKWWFAAGEHIPGTNLVQPTRVLVDRTGSGKRSLGTFRLRGPLKYTVSCRGRGQLLVQFTPLPSKPGQFTWPDCPALEVGGTYVGTIGDRVRIAVFRAGPKVTWTVKVRERVMK